VGGVRLRKRSGNEELGRLPRIHVQSLLTVLLQNSYNCAVVNNPTSALTTGKSIIYIPRTRAKISGVTIVASDSMTNLGVLTASLPQVIFSLGVAPEYDPYEVVESLI
jgi:hypothetical protein